MLCCILVATRLEQANGSCAQFSPPLFICRGREQLKIPSSASMTIQDYHGATGSAKEVICDEEG